MSVLVAHCPWTVCTGSPVCSPFICCFTAGSEEVKMAVLSALASWASKSAETVQSDIVSFIALGLKEKETLRKGHLRCLRAICKNSDLLTRVRNSLHYIFVNKQFVLNVPTCSMP